MVVSFDQGAARVVSMMPFSQKAGASGVTDILLVQPPFSSFGSPLEINSVVSVLARSDASRFSASVLRPDGVLTPFSSDLGVLNRELHSSASAPYIGSLARWQLAEETAFLKLRSLPGRHVIVLLFNSANPYRIPGKDDFDRDRSLDFFARYNLAAVYHLLPAVDLTLTIPKGDASTESPLLGSMPDSIGAEQSQQMQAASAAQSSLWYAEMNSGDVSAGEDEASIEQLMKDVILENTSTYDLIVQPLFSCSGTGFRNVSISTRVEGETVFSPQSMQMIPYAPPREGQATRK